MERYFSETELRKHSFLIDNDNYFSFNAIDIDNLEDIPTVNVKPIEHGFWIENEFNSPVKHNGYMCNKCGFESLFDFEGYSNCSSYCPHCGAKMVNF